MDNSRRRLPHQQPDGRWLFVTWHLHGSLPHGLYPPARKLNSGRAFVWMDRHLDMQTSGAQYLRQDEIAGVVVASLGRGIELGHYDLGAWVIMPNHVHALLLPRISTSRLMASLKGVTAREANKILDRTGSTFWQAESYDHWVRDEREFDRITSYIEDNPVKAGLAVEYRWSSAGAEMSTHAPRGVQRHFCQSALGPTKEAPR